MCESQRGAECDEDERRKLRWLVVKKRAVLALGCARTRRCTASSTKNLADSFSSQPSPLTSELAKLPLLLCFAMVVSRLFVND